MRTDRAPFDYLYLSQRLLTDVMHHEEAARPRRRTSYDLTLPFVRGVGVHFDSTGPDFGNLRDLAMRSVDVISDNTGTVEDPGPYIRGQLDMEYGILRPHMGWPGGAVACYRAATTTSDGRSVIVTLFGSTSNVVGRRYSDDTSAEYPSDMAGLYGLLDAQREPGDPDIDLSRVWDDAALERGVRARIAAETAQRIVKSGTRPVDFIAQVFDDVDTVAGRVILGAPLWISTPRPTAVGRSGPRLK